MSRRTLWTSLLGLSLVFAWADVRAQDRAALEEQEELAFKKAAGVASASIVRIETVGGLDRIGQVLTGTGPTTGVVVSPDGYVVTSAFNFASKPASILVTLPDGRRLPATQVAVDRSRMLALIKVEAENLTLLEPAPKESYKVGQWAIALGKTFDGDVPSISVGIISAIGRIWGRALQTDAKVSPVNYGGPLVDVEGKALGILVPLSPQATGEVAGVEWYDAGIGFAIPMVDVLAAVERLKGGKDLLPGLLGITFKGTNLYEGVPTIDRVRYGSPAHGAGLLSGDVLVEVEGQPVVREAQVRHQLGNKYAGEKVTVVVKRGDERIERQVELAGELVPYEFPFLGLLPLRVDATEPAKPGVPVRAVFPNSPADKAGIKEGERILKVGDAVVNDAAALLDQLSRKRPGDKVSLVVFDNSQERTLEIALATLPEQVPAEVAPSFIPVSANPPPKEQQPKTGRFTDKLAAHDDHEYWAYVPADYNPNYKYGLVVWIHPGGDTMEATISQHWRGICEQRGLILIAPKAKEISGWQANEEEFITDLVDDFFNRYSIDRSRVVAHSYSKGGPFTLGLALKFRDHFRGAAVAAAPLMTPPPDNEAEKRLQFYLICGKKDSQLPLVERTAAGLKSFKYPVVFKIVEEGEHAYPGAEDLEELARWVDSLDRL